MGPDLLRAGLFLLFHNPRDSVQRQALRSPMTWADSLEEMVRRSQPPEPPRAAYAELVVSREDIEFWDLDEDTVRLQVRVHNRGARPSVATRMSIGAAPLGAFLDSVPMGRADIPPIPPGGSTVVTADFPRDDLPESSSSRKDSHLLGLRSEASLPCGWVGNFDIHVSDVGAERHCARLVALTAGRINLAFFQTGTGTRDHYLFRFLGDQSWAWNPRIVWRGSPLPTEEPVAITRAFLQLLIEPQEGTTVGCLAVEVTQESTGKVALVEFGFGVDAIPGRCFRS